MALWNDILGCHYNYIATDESLEKLQERENLEGDLSFLDLFDEIFLTYLLHL